MKHAQTNKHVPPRVHCARQYYITAQFIVCRRSARVKAVALAEVATSAHPERCATTLGAARVRTYIWAVSTSPTRRAHTSSSWLLTWATGGNLRSEPVFVRGLERGGLLTLALPPPGTYGTPGSIARGPPFVPASSIRHPCDLLHERICIACAAAASCSMVRSDHAAPSLLHISQMPPSK